MSRFTLLAAGLLLALPATAGAQPCTNPAAGHPVRAVYLAGIDAFNAHDLDRFLEQWDDDVHMFTPTGWLRGRDAVRERFAETFAQFPRVRMEVRDLRVCSLTGDVATVEFEWSVYPMGAGPAFHGVGSGVYVRRGDRWVEVLEHETVVRTDEALRPSTSPSGGRP